MLELAVAGYTVYEALVKGELFSIRYRYANLIIFRDLPSGDV